MSFNLYPEIDNDPITAIYWRFKGDWGYVIKHCTPYGYTLKFPVTPPILNIKTWEVTVTPEDVEIKCNTLQVLHFIYNNTHFADCTSKVKGKKVAKIRFSHSNIDTATKTFKSELVGKNMIFDIYASTLLDMRGRLLYHVIRLYHVITT